MSKYLQIISLQSGLFLQPGTHFWANPKHIPNRLRSSQNNEDILCCYNSYSPELDKIDPYIIFVPKNYGVSCFTDHPVWIDKILPLQWNHIYINKDELERFFIRKM